MFKQIMFILSLCFSLPVLGQDIGIINGTLFGDNEPIDYASLVLRASGDSSIVKTSLSDSLGGYEFLNVPYGDYFVEAIHLSFNNTSTDVFTFASKEYVMPQIDMSTSAATLATAVVTSRRPLIQRKIDRTVINVDASPLAAGGSAVDVLEVAPGVMVDRNGNISLAGKDGVLIFINGRQTYLSGTDLIALLENLSAAELSQIEIMTTPPARYDASGNAGVINIKTKKLSLKGYNGSLSLGYRKGKYPIIDQSGVFNYRNQRVNLFGNIGLKSTKTFEDYYIVRNLRDFDTNELQTIYNQNTNQVRKSESLNARLGMDYYLSDKTTFGLSGSYFMNNGESTTDNKTVLKTPEGITETTIVAPNTGEVKWNNYNINLNLLHEFAGSDHSIFFDFDHMKYTTTNQQNFDNFYYLGDLGSNDEPYLQETSKSVFPQDIQIYSFKGDYARPIFGEKGTFELDFKSSFVQTDNLTEFFDLSDEIFVLDETLSNQFRYSEFINAAYTNLSYAITPKWSAQFGLRLEQTNATGKQFIADQSFKRNNLQLFPTFYLSYELSELDQLGISYGRRIERPDYADMNPFREYLDQFTYQEGNPNLKPQISNNLELTYIGLGGKLAAVAYYNQINDVIQESISQNVAETETFIRPENLASSQLYGAYLAADLELSNFYLANFYFNYYRQSSEGIVNEKPFDIAGNTFSARFLNMFSFGDSWRFDVAGWYTSRTIESTFVRKPVGRISSGIQKKFLDGNATIRLTAMDVFNWNRFEGTSNFQNIDVSVNNTWQSSTWRVSLRYKFNKGLGKGRKNRDSSIEDETDRVNINE